MSRNKNPMQTADSLRKTAAGKDWGQDERVTEDDVVGAHHQLIGHDLGQTSGDG